MNAAQTVESNDSRPVPYVVARERDAELTHQQAKDAATAAARVALLVRKTKVHKAYVFMTTKKAVKIEPLLPFPVGMNVSDAAVQLQLSVKKGLLDILAQCDREGIKNHSHRFCRGWCRPLNENLQAVINDAADSDSSLSQLIDELFEPVENTLDDGATQLEGFQHFCRLLNKHFNRTTQGQTMRRLICFRAS